MLTSSHPRHHSLMKEGRCEEWATNNTATITQGDISVEILQDMDIHLDMATLITTQLHHHFLSIYSEKNKLLKIIYRK